MDAKFNSPSDARISLPKIIFVSLIPGVVFGIFTYYFFEWYILYYHAEIHSLNLMYAIICTVLFYLLSVYVGITYGRIFYRRSSSKSLKNFKAFTDALHAGINEKSVYHSLHSYISNIFGSAKIAIYFKDTANENSNAWDNYPHNTMPICNMAPRSCPVICQGKECFVNDIQTDLTCAYQLPYFKTGSYICLKMELDNSPHCVLQLYHTEKDYFDMDTVNDIRSYIEMTKPVIEQKNKMKDLNIEAYTDKLTQVKNRTFLEQELSIFIENSTKTSEPLSVIMVDLDFFKKINDNYGHPAGDCVLVEFASICLNCIRAADLVCRYGGEEFLVILPNANAAYASSIAERIRKSVANARMPVFQGTQLPNLTCSLGVSTFPDYSSDKISLIKTADMALYSAKHNGRNKVVTFDPYDVSIQS